MNHSQHYGNDDDGRALARARLAGRPRLELGCQTPETGAYRHVPAEAEAAVGGWIETALLGDAAKRERETRRRQGLGDDLKAGWARYHAELAE